MGFTIQIPFKRYVFFTFSTDKRSNSFILIFKPIFSHIYLKIKRVFKQASRCFGAAGPNRCELRGGCRRGRGGLRGRRCRAGRGSASTP